MGFLSQAARRRIAALLLVLGIGVAALAVADVGPFENPPTQEELAREVVGDFFTAAAKENFKRSCSLLTDQAEALIRAKAARLIGNRKVECPQILRLASGALKGGKLTVNELSVSGNRARAEVDFKVPKTEGEGSRTVLLELERGVWRISDAG